MKRANGIPYTEDEQKMLEDLADIKLKISMCRSTMHCPDSPSRPCEDCDFFNACNMLTMAERCIRVAINDLIRNY